MKLKKYSQFTRDEKNFDREFKIQANLNYAISLLWQIVEKKQRIEPFNPPYKVIRSYDQRWVTWLVLIDQKPHDHQWWSVKWRCALRALLHAHGCTRTDVRLPHVERPTISKMVKTPSISTLLQNGQNALCITPSSILMNFGRFFLTRQCWD